MSSPKEIVTTIDEFVDEFSAKMTPIQKDLYNRVELLIKDITVDAEGNIKRTTKNLNIINKVKAELEGVIRKPEYQDLVSNIQESLDEVNTLQESYYAKIDKAFETPKVMATIQKQAFDTSVADLTEAGINTNVVSEAVTLLQNNISEGASFSTMQSQLEDFIIGNAETDGKLVSYSRQIMSDTMHMTSRKYNALAVDDLGLVWYQYIGSEKPTSRPFCIAMLDKEWVHESELAKCARGSIDGKQISLAGLMPDTTGSNLVDRCGGYNCAHALIAVPAENVPNQVRKRFEVEEAE